MNESTGLANWCVPLSIIIQVTSQIIYDKLSPFLKHNDMLLKHNVISFNTPLQINIAFPLNITSNNLVHIVDITRVDLWDVSLSSTLNETPSLEEEISDKYLFGSTCTMEKKFR